MSVDFNKTGVIDSTVSDEYKTLSDGSVWLLILYHNNKSGTKYFNSSNCMNNQDDFDLYSRLYMIPNYQSTDGYYEFMALQPDNSVSTIYRWKQTNEPTTTTSITGLTSIDGYTSTNGLCKCSGNTYLAHSNSTSNWWCACGSYTNWNSAVPGFGGATVKCILMLYIRIDNTSHNDFKIFNNEFDASSINEV